MKISKIISGIFASAVAAAGSCPDMCDCTNENKVVICAFKGLTTFPDISKSPDIEDFMLVNNKITSLPRLANQLPRLRSINLSNNQLTSISRGSLPDSIEDAWLDSNLVETISRKIFSNLSNMKRVYLMNNKISIIEPGSFSGLPSLLELKLSNNELTKIPTLTESKSLLLLDLSNNRLSDLDGTLLELPNLERLDLQGNSLLSFSGLKLPALAQINLSSNRLTSLDSSILDSEGLTSLDISANPLNELPMDIFEKLGELKSLNVADTYLQKIPKIPNSVLLNDLNLRNINLKCNCEMTWMIDYFQTFGQHIRSLRQVTCQDNENQTHNILELDLPECSATDSGPLPSFDLDTNDEDSLCANFECQHGAKCKVVNKRPKCECYPAWGGRHCEQLLVQPVATSTELEDTTSSSVLPRIWTETITENSVEVFFTRGSHYNTRLKLYIREDGNGFIPKDFANVQNGNSFVFTDLAPGSDYKVCHVTTTSCINFRTEAEAYSMLTEDPIVTSPRSDESSIGSETIGGVVGAAVLILMMCCAAIFVKKRRFSSHSKGSSSNGCESGCEETNTWKYSSGSNDGRSDNMTPNSYFSNNDSYTNAYASGPKPTHFPDVTNQNTNQIVKYHYQPTTSTPHKAQSNRHSQIILDHQGMIQQSLGGQHALSQSMGGQPVIGVPHGQIHGHSHQNSFNQFHTSQPPANKHFYSHSFTQPRNDPNEFRY